MPGGKQSERDIVVEIHWWFVVLCWRVVLRSRTSLLAAAELVAALWLLRLTPTALLAACGWLTATCWCAAAGTAAEHLHGAAHVNDDFGGVFFNASLIGPFTGLQCAFDVDLRTFLQVFACDFC